MDRFAIIKDIGTRRKLDVSAICRCCGLEYEEKYSILDQVSFDGVEFKDKLQTLTGINVQHQDKMPQAMCIVCLDKINDFYEFRLMAQNTEKQTRQALGLPLTSYVQSKKEVKVNEDEMLLDRVLARVKGETVSGTRKRAVTAAVIEQQPTKKARNDLSCKICEDSSFSYFNDLYDHQMKEHLPVFAKYACGSCRETFNQLSDFKAHETMHSRMRMPYVCPFCKIKFSKLQQYTKHMTNYNCGKKEKPEVTMEDIKCFQCKKKFLTQNLFEWHGCFIKTKGSCSKCGKYFAKKQSLFKHYINCTERFSAPVKAEKSVAKETDKKAAKASKTKATPARKASTIPIFKSELDIGPPPESDDLEADITYDNFGNDSDSNDGPSGSALTPEVNLEEHQTIPALVIVKSEKIHDPLTVMMKSVAFPNRAAQIRNIKKERAEQAAIINTQTKETTALRINIKPERSGSQPAVQVLNPFATKAKPKVGPKSVFKNPIALMKIKAEKRDAGYGDNEERDEAEAEDEDLFGDSEEVPIVQVKKEKLDPSYGDPNGKKKQLINPLALMREKAALTNGTTESFLVISAVTSINTENNAKEGDGTMTHDDVDASAKPPETPFTNDVAVSEPRENSTMVQIPNEYMVNHESHSSPSECVDSSPANITELIPENVAKEILPANSDEVLDALLQQYQDASPADDNNDIFQELLKFD